LGLSTRARNALERANVITVRDFLNFPIPDIHMMRGVGNQTRREILGFLGELRTRFPNVEPIRPKDTGESLKFSECVPRDVACEVFLARFSAPEIWTALLGECRRPVSMPSTLD
jgi:hypothetical protein